jgi:hypothetical protein
VVAIGKRICIPDHICSPKMSLQLHTWDAL